MHRARLIRALALPLTLCLAQEPASSSPQRSSPGRAPAPAQSWSAEGDGFRIALQDYHLTARVDARGLRVEADLAWARTRNERTAVRVRSLSFGRGESCELLAPATPEQAGDRIELRHEGLVEWYRTADLGIEQGWTITNAPPAQPGLPLCIGLEFEGLAPQVSDDGLCIRLVDERAQVKLRFSGLIATDAEGRRLAARFGIGAQGLGVLVADSGATYPITVDPVLGPNVWSFESDQTGAGLASACAAGDVNGDGYGDLLVAAQGYDTGAGADAGMAWVFYGSASGLAVLPSWSSSGPNQAGALFGSSVTPLGDVNGDGYDDLAIAARRYSNGQSHEGALFVYLGGALGLQSTPFWTLESDLVDEQIDAAFYLGDVNGDGKDDLGTVSNAVNSAVATVKVYHGAATPPLAASWSITAASLGLAAADFTNLRLVGAGDVDADGYDDVILSCDHGQAPPQRVYLFRGSASGLSTSPSWSATTPSSAPQSLGWCGALGDVNGDGYADIVVTDLDYPANPGGAAFLYFADPLAHPGTVFASTPTQTIQGTSGFGQNAGSFAADVNGDGFSDLIAADFGTGEGHVYLGGASGVSPTASYTLTGPQAGSSFGSNAGTAGDVDGDGISDAFFVDPGRDHPQADEGAVYVYYGQSPDTVLNTPSAPLHPAAMSGTTTSRFGSSLSASGDVNGDGFSDLLVGSPEFDNSFGDAGKAELHLGSKDGVGTSSVWAIEGQGAGRKLGTAVAFAGDVDDDGFGDVLVGEPNFTGTFSNQGRFQLFRGNASGLLGSTPAFTFSPGEPGALLGTSLATAGDINGDGLADVIVGAPGAHAGQSDRGAAYVFYGKRSAPYLVVGPVLDAGVAGARFGTAVSIAGDVDGDGFSDVLVGAPRGGNLLEEGIAYLYAGSIAGLGTSPNWSYVPGVAGAHFGSSVCAAGDVNGDGLSDILVGAPEYRHASGGAFVFRGKTGAPPNIAVPPLAILSGNAGTDLAPAIHHGTAFHPVFVALGDLNADGNSDAVALTGSGSGYSVLLGDGLGGLSAHVEYPSLTLATNFALGDFNSDGRLDLVQTGLASGFVNKLALQLGNGAGGFGAATTFTIPAAGPLALGDVNADGKLDVVVAGGGLGNSTMVVLLGNGSGGFPSISSFSLGSTARWIAIGDVNHDSTLDLVVAIWNPSGLVTVLPGNGAGGFSIGASYPVGQYAQYVTLADLNADGNKDIVTANNDATKPVSVLLGNGVGGFGTAVHYNVGNACSCYPMAVEAADVDSDGKLDLVTATVVTNTVSVLPGDGLGGFSAPINYAAELAPNAIAVGDLNGDGAPDIVDANQNSDSLSVFLGQAGRFGAALASAGDLNGDGFSDIAVGAPSFNAGQLGQGRFCAFLGASSGVVTTPAYVQNGTTAGGNLGGGIASAGDQDGDGYSDLVVGGPGLGSASGGLVLREGGTSGGNVLASQQRRSNDLFAIQHLCLADSTVNTLLKGSAKTYLNVPSTVAGRERIRLEWELKRMPLPLDGTSLQHGTGVPGASWVDCGLTSTLAVPVPSLQPQFGYHWRMRVQNRNPLFPHSRWVTIQGNGRQEKKFGTGTDCNGNNTPDDLDIANLSSADCDPIGPTGPDGIPDECELAGDDLDADSVPDKCEAQIPFCTPGSGGVTSCPCLNDPVGANRGCQNSLGTGGATLSGGGNASLANDTFVLTASGIGSAGSSCTGTQLNLTCIVLQGSVLNATGTSFGDGVRCLGGVQKRLYVHNSAAGTLVAPQGTDPSVSVRSAALGDPIDASNPASGTRYYLVYYRDACASYCPASNFNASSGWRVIWVQ